MRTFGARIFLSLLAGKLDTTEQRLPWQQSRQRIRVITLCVKVLINSRQNKIKVFVK